MGFCCRVERTPVSEGTDPALTHWGPTSPSSAGKRPGKGTSLQVSSFLCLHRCPVTVVLPSPSRQTDGLPPPLRRPVSVRAAKSRYSSPGCSCLKTPATHAQSGFGRRRERHFTDHGRHEEQHGTGQQPQHGCPESIHQAASDDVVTLLRFSPSSGRRDNVQREPSQPIPGDTGPSFPVTPLWHHPRESHPPLVVPDGRGGHPSPESRDAPVQPEPVTAESDRRRLLLDLGGF